MQRRTILKGAVSAAVLTGSGLTHGFSDAPQEAYDVVIVGSGAAGLTAAISAREAGARRVAVLEKFAMVGGHSILSSGSVSVAFRNPKSADPERNLRRMVEEMSRVGGAQARPELIRTLVEESEDVVRWLGAMGVRWNRRLFRAVGGLSVNSISTGNPQAGYDYIQVLMNRARALGVDFLLSTRAVGLATRNNRVTGVYALRSTSVPQSGTMPEGIFPEGEAKLISAYGIILATGGFTANPAMRTLYDASIPASLPTTANPLKLGLDGATGDGILMAQAVGAELTGMQYIQIIPYSGGRLLDHVGGEIWINDAGRRFVYEGSPFRKLRLAIADDDGFWAISDSQTSKGGSLATKLLQGTVRKAETIEELARSIHVNTTVLRQTIERWNTFVANGYDADFAVPITDGSTIRVPPFFYGWESWSVHYTCGGIAINRQAEVLRSTGDVIEGLYAAGETTGGIHGEDRLGGNSLIDCFVFGMIAGRAAASSALEAGRCGVI